MVRGLRRHLAGARISAAVIRTPAIVRGPAPDWDALQAAVVASVARAGKYIVIEAAGEGGRWQLMVHLGMTGKLLLQPAAAPAAPHTHAWLELADGRELRFGDPRRFGRWALAPAPPTGWAAELRVASGREPLTVTAAEFEQLFWRRAAPIKSALLNQTLLRGIGNIYADESLHRAGIHPRARQLSRPRLQRLRLAIRAVLREAIAAGGSSIADYVDSSGQRGWFQIRHRVYGRAGEPCPACRTPIRRIVLHGRAAHFCPRCQTL